MKNGAIFIKKDVLINKYCKDFHLGQNDKLKKFTKYSIGLSISVAISMQVLNKGILG